ncbi:MAG: hypothetical protein CXR31_01185 [Geobacter sp.]|nr:MAG: hypothetical protein CXR31_01185 [Geobacter sp.]
MPQNQQKRRDVAATCASSYAYSLRLLVFFVLLAMLAVAVPMFPSLMTAPVFFPVDSFLLATIDVDTHTRRCRQAAVNTNIGTRGCRQPGRRWG